VEELAGLFFMRRYKFKILILNIENGGNSSLINSLMQMSDIVVVALVEFQLVNRAKFTTILSSKGFTSFQGPDVPKTAGIRNSVFVASKGIITNKLKPNSISQVKHFWEEFSLGNGLNVLSVYVPVASGTWTKYKNIIWKAILARAKVAQEQKEKLIIMGDLNTALPADCSVGSTVGDYNIVTLKKYGFIDSWEYKHANDTSNNRWTWYDGQGNGKRLDYIFISKELKSSIKSADHLHSFRMGRSTDHSAVAIELSL